VAEEIAAGSAAVRAAWLAGGVENSGPDFAAFVIESRKHGCLASLIGASELDLSRSAVRRGLKFAVISPIYSMEPL